MHTDRIHRWGIHRKYKAQEKDFIVIKWPESWLMANV